MRVYKFGGASIADASRMAALLPIINSEQEPLLIVISALGKTTNALEDILNAACAGDKQVATTLTSEIKKKHLEYAKQLLDNDFFERFQSNVSQYFFELDNNVSLASAERYDESYDQIVCMGELLSSMLLHHFLVQHGSKTVWIDVRTVIRTDDTFRDAVINWNHTKLEAEATIGRKLKQGNIVVTQGFIGSTESGKSVTLGREGSDYTAAVLAAMLKLESVTIWKDVDGFRNADPKLFNNTVKIEAISYTEVIEMAFYGAQIIHPKTIKPLHNHNIPLYVKCFLNKELAGSVIKADVNETNYPPLIVLKNMQVLVQVTTRDFSFITEDNLSKIYSVFHKLKVKINLIQNAAISFVACIDNRADKVKTLIEELGKDYKVSLNENVSILTVRHFTPEVLFELTKDRKVFLKQETRKTVQAVLQ